LDRQTLANRVEIGYGQSTNQEGVPRFF